MRNPADLVNRPHKALDIRLILFSREPFPPAPFPLLSGDQYPGGREMMSRVEPDLAMEFAVGQLQPVSETVPLDNAVPAVAPALAIFDVGVAQHLVHGVAQRH